MKVVFLTQEKCSKGIYIILDDLTGKFYLGSCFGEKGRFFSIRASNHRSKLKNNKHNSIYLQNAYNKREKEHFNMFIIENLDNLSREEILDIEQWYIDNWNPAYNGSKIASGWNGKSEVGNKKNADKMSKNYVLISPKGIKYKIKNLKDFCRKNKLDYIAFSKLANGYGNQYKGWQCFHSSNKIISLDKLKKKANKSRSKNRQKEYLLTFTKENNRKKKIKGLYKWCGKHNICPKIKQRKINGFIIKYIGFIKEGITIEELNNKNLIDWNNIRKNYKNQKNKDNNAKYEYTVIYPDGIELITNNLYEFASFHDLEYRNLQACVYGTRKTCSGFKCRKN